MPDAKIRWTADAKQAIAETQKLEKATGSATQRMGADFGGLKLATAAAFAAMAGAAVAVKKAFDQTVGVFQDYSLTVATMAQKTGASVESMSALIQVADDARISQQQLTESMRGALRSGFNPTIANLEALADKYVGLNDPIARAKLLTDTFGRSGLEMGRMFEKGAAGIKASITQAERFGLVLDKEAIAKAEALHAALDDMDDALFGLKVQIGAGVVPAVTRLADGLLTWFDIARDGQIILAEATVQTLEWAAALPMASDGLKLVAEGLRENLTANLAANEILGETGPITDEVAGKMDKLAQRTGDARHAFDGLKLAAADAIQGQLDMATWAAGGGVEVETAVRDITAAYDSGNLSLGEMRGLLQWTQLETLRLQVNAGLITFEEASATARDLGLSLETPRKSMDEIRADFDRLQSKDVTVTIHENIIRTIRRGDEAPTKRQHGGRLSPITEVGEAGTEGIIGDVVIPHGMWESMKRLGLLPGRRMAGGGMIDGLVGVGGAYSKSGAGSAGYSENTAAWLSGGSGGGGGRRRGAAGLTAAAGETRAAVEQAVAASAQVAAAAVGRVGSEIASVQTAQALELQRSMTQVATGQQQLATLLRELIEVTRSIGTADLIGEALGHELQTFQAGA
jgi:hypothetical protein